MKKAQWIKADGTTTDVTPANGTDFTLEEMQGFVGGMVEHIDLRGRDMWLNEEGKMNDLPLNRRATELFDASYGRGLDVIVGDVLVTDKGMVK